VEVKLTAALRIDENGKYMNRFYPLTLEFSKVNGLSLSWTIVHAIDERSPLYNLTHDDMKVMNLEILVFVKAFDEVFSNTVMSRNSYITDEIVWGGKFRIMYHPNDDKTKTVLDLAMIDDYDRVDLALFSATIQPAAG